MPSRPATPRRPTSAAVYRRRRLVAAGLAVLLLLLVGWGLGALISRGVAAASGDAEPSESAPPSAVSSPTPAAARDEASGEAEAAVDPASVGECAPSGIRLTAAADQEDYAPGEEAVLSLGVANLSSTPCRLDVGTAQQEFAVQDPQGGQVFSTRVCQVDPRHEERVLEPHQEQTAVYRWNGRASNPDCAVAGPPAALGAYLLTVSLGDLESRPVSFRIADDPSAAPSASGSASSSAPAPSSGTAAPASATPSAASAAPAPAPASPSVPSPTAGTASGNARP